MGYKVLKQKLVSRFRKIFESLFTPIADRNFIAPAGGMGNLMNMYSIRAAKRVVKERKLIAEKQKNMDVCALFIAPGSRSDVNQRAFQ